MTITNVGLAKQAYKGAPRGIRHQWPDEVDFKHKPHWSYDEHVAKWSRKSAAAKVRAKIAILKKNFLDTI